MEGRHPREGGGRGTSGEAGKGPHLEGPDGAGPAGSLTPGFGPPALGDSQALRDKLSSARCLVTRHRDTAQAPRSGEGTGRA